ncbi:hypothetical protein SAMN05428964_103460 [Thalassospira xiamenensis]|uniref:Uncharacterized protein n=1 Tax=Thalassospira xiamenensis TaxID=220697 RepID=A0A285THW8_9PROT|nr:hypothetical protein SAMN05428964_103460 [Thalassospira xiamenensis]
MAAKMSPPVGNHEQDQLKPDIQAVGHGGCWFTLSPGQSIMPTITPTKLKRLYDGNDTSARNRVREPQKS